MTQSQICDELGKRIQPLLPKRPRDSHVGGRPRIDDRIILEGILFIPKPACHGDGCRSVVRLESLTYGLPIPSGIAPLTAGPAPYRYSHRCRSW